MYDALPKTRQYFGSEERDPIARGSAYQDQFGYDYQAKWSSTITSKLLVEAGFSQNFLGYNLAYQPGTPGPSDAEPIRSDLQKRCGHREQGCLQCPGHSVLQPVRGEGGGGVGHVRHWIAQHQARHAGQVRVDQEQPDANGNMVQVYNNGVPLQVRVYNTPIVSRSNLNGDVGIYLQDSWKIR